MQKRPLLKIIVLFLLISLCGCSANTATPTQTNANNHDEALLIGKWELLGDNGYYENYEFTSDHQVIIENRTLGKWVKSVYNYEELAGALVFTDGQYFEGNVFTQNLDKLGMISYRINDNTLTIFNNTYTRIDAFTSNYGT